MQAILAEVYESLGDPDGARAAIDLSDDLGGEDDLLNVVITHAVRARLALADGDHDAAERWARSAVEHAFSTDNTFLQGNAQLALARVLATLGRRDEASSNARAALELFQVKGDRPRADRARELIDELAGHASPWLAGRSGAMIAKEAAAASSFEQGVAANDCCVPNSPRPDPKRHPATRWARSDRAVAR